MRLEPFQMERMQSEWENRVAHNLSESGVHPLSVEELLDPADREKLLRERLVYIQSNGTEALRAAIAALYPGAEARNVVVTTGTAEANYIAIWRLVEPGDEVVMMLPNYMQIWGVVRAQGAQVLEWKLREEADWAPDLDELARLLTPRTRLVVVCNPNNPTGSVLGAEAMRGIVARAVSLSRSPSGVRGLCIPGVSTNTIWVSGWFSTPWMRCRVVWGLSETIATFCPRIWLSRVDLPTLGRPTSVTNPDRKLTGRPYPENTNVLALPSTQ